MSSVAALIEAILFLEAGPVEIQQLAKIADLDVEIVSRALAELKTNFSTNQHGLTLVEIDDGFAISLKREFWDHLRHQYGKREVGKLSRAALETLSIIAYYQPVTRYEIESIRGVKADAMMRLLTKRGLVKAVGKKDVPGKPVQYGTTREFLKVFKLKSISHLPKLEDQEADRFRKT